jgi:predicted acylesterase/phospholipase RssA
LCHRSCGLLLALLFLGMINPSVGLAQETSLNTKQFMFKDRLSTAFNSHLSYKQIEHSNSFKDFKSQLNQVQKSVKKVPGDPLVFDIGIGNEYQILTWLKKGQIDMARLSPLSLYHLSKGYKKDESNHLFVELKTQGFEGDEVSSTEYRPFIRSFDCKEEKWRSHPENDFQNFIESVEKKSDFSSEEETFAYRLYSPSHLSLPGMFFPVLLAKDHLDLNEKDIAINDKRDNTAFWELFFEKLEFLITSSASGSKTLCENHNGISLEFSGKRNSNTLTSSGLGWRPYPIPKKLDDVWSSLTSLYVVRKSVANKFIKKSRLKSIENRFLAFNKWVEEVSHEPGLGEKLFPSLSEEGENPHYFSFTPQELIRLIKRDQKNSGIEQSALVLSGGGVKAAYQSKIIDLFYQNKLLRNKGYAESPLQFQPSNSLEVDLVVGNSGGAILGMFSADLEENDPRQISETLWKTSDGDFIGHENIFRFWDILRWASIMICCWVFAFVLFNARLFGLIQVKQVYEETRDEQSRLRYSLLWILILGLSPLILKYVNGPPGSEHVPEIEGHFYFFILLIGVLVDNCFVPSQKVKSATSKLTFWVPILLGISLIIYPLTIRKLADQGQVTGSLDNELFLSLTTGGALTCLGILSIITGIVLWKKFGENRFELTGEKEFLNALLLILSSPFLTYLILYPLFSQEIITSFELNLSFWIWLLGTASLVSIIILGLRSRVGFIERGITYLYTFHHAGNIRITRGVRTILYCSIGWLWWNLIIGPGLYGNAQAQQHLLCSTERFTQPNPNCYKPDLEKIDHWNFDLQTNLIVPTVSLSNKEDRYFLFRPTHDTSVKNIGLDPSRMEEIRLDSRWRFVDQDCIVKIVFASGSPFPIFPPHLIQCAGYEKEWLVDGGYAHNVPIEAAKNVGSRQLLIVNSTPNSREGSLQNPDPHKIIFGQMVLNLSRLLPFLYKQSQAADNLSQEGLLVASIAPSGDVENWPSLFDFRKRVVLRMLKKATSDFDNNKRIGRIENWGSPSLFRVRVQTPYGLE